MRNFTISSMQQVGIGTMDFRKSWDWYIKCMSKGYVFKTSDLELDPDTPSREVMAKVKALFD